MGITAICTTKCTTKEHGLVEVGEIKGFSCEVFDPSKCKELKHFEPVDIFEEDIFEPGDIFEEDEGQPKGSDTFLGRLFPKSE